MNDEQPTRKTYTISSTDDHLLKRAIQADAMAYVLSEMDNDLRNREKYSECEVEQQHAERWRDTLRSIAHDNGIVISDLFL